MNQKRNPARSSSPTISNGSVQNPQRRSGSAAALRVVRQEFETDKNPSQNHSATPLRPEIHTDPKTVSDEMVRKRQIDSVRRSARRIVRAKIIIGLSVLIFLLFILSILIPKAQAGHGHGGFGHFGAGIAATGANVQTETYVYQYGRNGLWYQAGVLRDDHRKLFPGIWGRGAAQYDNWSDYGSCPDYGAPGSYCPQPYQTYW